MKINEKIYMLRKKFGWSQDELAEKLSVSRQSVSKWETGDSIPEPSKLLAIAKIFSVSTDYLLDDSMQEYIPLTATKSNDTADKVFNKIGALLKNYGWIIGVILLLIGLSRVINLGSQILTLLNAGAFNVLGTSVFLPLAFSILTGFVFIVGGVIMIKLLRKDKEKTNDE